MKRIFFLLFFIPVFAKAQLYQTIPQRSEFKDSIKLDKNKNNAAGDSILSTDINGRIINVIKPAGTGGGGSTDTTSLSNRIDARVKYIDTSTMLSPYINSVGFGLIKTGQQAKVDSNAIKALSGWGGGIDTTNKFTSTITSINDSTLRVYKGTSQTDLLIRGNETKISTRDINYISTDAFSSLTGYTAVGSPSYSVTGGKVVFTGTGGGGVNVISKYIKNDLKVLNECNTLSATITLDAAPSSTSYGVSIGYKSYSTYGSTQSITAGICTATGANFGKLFIYTNYTSIVNYGNANTNLNSGDVIKISFVQSGWTLRLGVQNYTQGWEESYEMSNTYGFNPLTHNSSQPAFFHNGGSVSIDSFKYIINAPANVDIMFVGNSLTYGQGVSMVGNGNRWTTLVGNSQMNIVSGGGSDVSQMMVDRVAEIVAIHPKRVILHDVVGNDIAQAISSATWQANLKSIRNTLVAAGIQVIFTNGSPRTGLDETPQKTFIEGESTFAGDMIIDTWSALLGTGTDLNSAYTSDGGTHYNDRGHQVMANAVNTALGYPTNRGITLQENTAFSDIGPGSIYRNVSYGLTMRAATGAIYDWVLHDVVGNAVMGVNTGTYDLYTNGKLGVGLLGGTSTANLHIKASTATAGTGQLKFNSGTLPTTPEIGLMNFKNGLWFIDSSNSVRDTIAGRKWVRDNISGGGTPTWQQTLTAGSTLTGSNVIDVGSSNSLLFNNAGTFAAVSTNSAYMMTAASGNTSLFTTSVGQSYMSMSRNGRTSDIRVLGDSIQIRPSLGNLYIDTLTNDVGTKALRYNPTTGLVSYADTTTGGGGSMVYPGAGIPLSTGAAWGTSITDNSANWNTAYTQTRQWDGGSTGLTAATGRTSLGGTTVGQNMFTLTNPSAITFPRFNADNTVTALSAASMLTALGAQASGTYVTAVSVATANGVSGSSSGGATPALTISLGAITPTSVNSVVVSGSATPTLAVTGTSSISNANTGDNSANSTYASDYRAANFVAGTNYQVPITAGDVTTSGATATIGAGKVTLAMQANMATASLVYRKTAGSGAPEVNTLATLKTDLAITKSDVGLGSVENTALSTWAGTANITTLGTIATGTWQGSIVAPAYLGTGASITTKFLRGDGTWQTLAGGGDMLSTNNLSDVANVTTSRNNILPSKTGNSLKVLRVNVGETDYELATISGGSLTVGSSAISSGTGTRLLYETSGNVLGEISGATSNGTTLTLSNPSINNVSGAYRTTATAAGTTTLTVADKFLQYFTGATTQTVVMPDATTLTAGMQYEIVNNSSDVVTVNKNGGTLIKAMAASTSMILTVTDISSAAGVYTTEYSTDLAIGNATATTLTATTVVATAGAGFQNMVVQTSGSAASWSLPAALQVTGAKFKVTIIGGGGQGGGTSTTAGQTGGGGGSGGVVVYYVTYVAGQNTMTYTVGAGGSTSTGSTTGQTGTASSIIYNSVTITASGGVGGLSGATNGAGGAGGAASGGTLNIAGFNGSSSGTMAATSNFQGDGGNTPLGFGQGGRMPSTAAGANGNPGLGYGAGGSGGRNGTGTTARNGGAGVIGVVIIEY